MLLDARETMNAGEARPIYVEVDAARAQTLQVLSTETDPAGTADPTYRLLDEDGAEVDSGPVTGYTATAVRKPSVWVNVDTDGLEVGSYTLELTFEAQGGGESFVRRYVRRVQVVVG